MATDPETGVSTLTAEETSEREKGLFWLSRPIKLAKGGEIRIGARVRVSSGAFTQEVDIDNTEKLTLLRVLLDPEAL